MAQNTNSANNSNKGPSDTIKAEKIRSNATKLVAIIGLLGVIISNIPALNDWWAKLAPNATHTAEASLTPPTIQITETIPVSSTLTPSATLTLTPTIIQVTEATPTPSAMPTTETPALISDCLQLSEDAPLPTPEVFQTIRDQEDNYLASPSNFESWVPVEGGWHSYTWKAFNESPKSYIVPENRQSSEGSYSVCIQAGSTDKPAEFALDTQPLPADKYLRLTFFFRTSGSPEVKVLLTISGGFTEIPDRTPKEPTIGLSDNIWSERSIVFIVPVHVNIDCSEGVDRRWTAGVWGCLNLRFVVTGEGTVWIDDVWVEASP